MSSFQTVFVIAIALSLALRWHGASGLSDEVEKYCKYLDCQKGKIKPGESFAATNFAFGYCTCGEQKQPGGDGRKSARYVPCNFGETFSLEAQKCVRGVATA
ncbi:uncharacterized protein LOC134210803 [Armigeres subalbatus]|uniref:uncharacterized protein LOC134210803 n=1 Tax=Armigeres subalbatus TaxID=124917 RepID=UPI002ED680A9